MSAKGMSRNILSFCGIALLASVAAMGQTQPGGMGQQPPPGQQPGMGTYPEVGASSDAPALEDQAFVRAMLESDAAEVQLGQMAQQKSPSDDVKQFGERMVENRKRLDSQLAPIAKQLGVRQSSDLSKKDKQLIAKLETLSGPQFDEEYIRAVVKDHEKAVKGFKSAAQAAQDPNVQQAAKMDGPVIEQHLQAIQQIAQVHNVNVEESKK